MKKAILLTAFGTSNKVDIEKCLYPFLEEVRDTVTEHEVFIVFTSRVIREKLLQKYDMQIYSPEGILKRLYFKNFDEVTIVPLYLIEGKGQRELEELKEKWKDSFKVLCLLKPLLSYNLQEVIDVFSKEEDNYLFIGHGIRNSINESFYELQSIADEKGKKIYFSTFEGEPSFNEVVSKIKALKIKEITLAPFLITTGYHTRKDIFSSDREDSYYSKLLKEGFSIKKDEVSLIEREKIRKLYIKRVIWCLKNN